MLNQKIYNSSHYNDRYNGKQVNQTDSAWKFHKQFFGKDHVEAVMGDSKRHDLTETHQRDNKISYEQHCGMKAHSWTTHKIQKRQNKISERFFEKKYCQSFYFWYESNSLNGFTYSWSVSLGDQTEMNDIGGKMIFDWPIILPRAPK